MQQSWYFLFQLVVNAEDKIIFLDERYPGNVHDSYVLVSTSLYDFAMAGRMNDFWILGDAG